MKAISIILLCSLIGCASENNQSTAGVSGAFVDSTHYDYLRNEFDDAKACTGFEAGDFHALTIIIMPPIFDCEAYAIGCSGEYRSPNLIKIGSATVFRHEAIHHLLDFNTGNLDREHRSSLFEDCGIRQ